jgi:hypothetical protein
MDFVFLSVLETDVKDNVSIFVIKGSVGKFKAGIIISMRNIAVTVMRDQLVVILARAVIVVVTDIVFFIFYLV